MQLKKIGIDVKTTVIFLMLLSGGFYTHHFSLAQVKHSPSATSRKAPKTIPSTSDALAWRINVGGDRLIDSRGREWLADQIYQAGSYGYLGISGTFKTDEIIVGTNDQEIFQTERYKLFGYRIDVPNGHYQIVLHFAEIYHDKPGERLMDIKIENKLVEANLDIFAKTGRNKALSLTFNTQELGIPIVDRRIDIDLVNKQDDTKLSGIEIIHLSQQPALLAIEPTTLDFGLRKNTVLLSVKNIGSKVAKWSIESTTLPKWLATPLPNEGTLSPGEKTEIQLRLDRATANSGVYQDSLILVSTGFRQKIVVRAAVSGPAKLNLETTSLDFGSAQRSLTVVLTNAGGSPLKWFIQSEQLPGWIERIYPTGGGLKMGERAFLNITITRKNSTAGVNQFNLTISSTGGAKTLLVKMNVPSAHGRRLFVKAAARGAKDGSSWENAFTSIKTAIASVGQLAARERVALWVAQGTYYEHDILVPAGFELYGGFQGNENYLDERNQVWDHPTIVDGQKRGRCFECLERTVIDGFVIQNGRDWGTGEGKGAAILTYDADVKIRNNLIRDNVDSWAGAVFVEGFDLKKKQKGVSPLIEYNVLINNSSNYCAAAIEIRGSAATVRNNTIVGNHGFGLEIQDLTGPFKNIIYGHFYNNIVTENRRLEYDDVWAEARKVTNYCYVGKKWDKWGKFPPYGTGTGNIFGDLSGQEVGFVNGQQGDFHLNPNSPAIDAGDPTSPRGPDGTRADLGAFPFNQKRSELKVMPMQLHFDAQSKSQWLTILAYGGQTVEWKAAVYKSEKLLTIHPTEGVIKNGEGTKLKITPNFLDLKEGEYAGYLALMTPEQSIEIPFSLLVNRTRPEIHVEPASIEVQAELNGAPPPEKRIRILNTGAGDFSWAALTAFKSKWLRFGRTSGRAGEMISVYFDTRSLDYGDYYDEINFIGAGTMNRSVTLPVMLKVRPGRFLVEIEAETSPALPNAGWQVVENEGSRCIRAMKNSNSAPNDSLRLDYEFFIPDGVEQIYVFAEVDVNRSKLTDSFWVKVNNFDPCSWDYLRAKYDGWHREWVYNHPRDEKHLFVAIPGKNTLNLFSRDVGAFINWLVITNDPEININTYKFGRVGRESQP